MPPRPSRTRARPDSASLRGEWPRKAIHLSFVILPLALLYLPLSHSQWRLLLVLLAVSSLGVDLVRLHDRRVGAIFRRYLGRMLREHERFDLLGSTYLLLASLLAVELFPLPVAVAALGFAVLGDGLAALVGKLVGRTRLFNKSLEGTAACLLACTTFALFLQGSGPLPLGVGLIGALVATLIEVLPIPLDDNLGMTLLAGYTMKVFYGP